MQLLNRGPKAPSVAEGVSGAFWIDQLSKFSPKLDDFVVRSYDEESKELRRLERWIRWRRSDPVEPLPPGTANEVSLTAVVGITNDRTISLAQALGVKVSADIAGVQGEINKQLTRETSSSVSVSQSEEVTKKRDPAE
jgi:hypothetical protein